MQHKGENRVHRLWYKEKREKLRNIYKESLGISSGMPVPPIPLATHHPKIQHFFPPYWAPAPRISEQSMQKRKPQTKDPSSRPVKAVVKEIR